MNFPTIFFCRWTKLSGKENLNFWQTIVGVTRAVFIRSEERKALAVNKIRLRPLVYQCPFHTGPQMCSVVKRYMKNPGKWSKFSFDRKTKPSQTSTNTNISQIYFKINDSSIHFLSTLIFHKKSLEFQF